VLVCRAFVRAADGPRTRDLELGKLALYQLSYHRLLGNLTRSAIYAGDVRRLAIPLLVSLAGAAVVGLLAYGLTAQSASRTLDEAVAHGAYPPAPQAGRSLPVLAGGSVGADPTGGAPGAHASGSLAAFHGKVVVLNFWASWCEPCQTEAPLLERAQRSLRRHDATVLGVTYLDASSDSQGFVREHHITYPNLRDTTGEFAHAYGTDQLPESFVVDRSGDIVKISRGEIDQEFLSGAIKLAESSS
jgi:cytochrome c biogenesis protein CcmG, thiol:disulfide interchange protein DsbE